MGVGRKRRGGCGGRTRRPDARTDGGDDGGECQSSGSRSGSSAGSVQAIRGGFSAKARYDRGLGGRARKMGATGRRPSAARARGGRLSCKERHGRRKRATAAAALGVTTTDGRRGGGAD